MIKKIVLIAFFLVFSASSSWAYENPPTIPSQQLPLPLQELWAKNKPELGPYGHCATAYDSRTNGDKMVFKCDMYVRLSAEGARRALAHCREDSLKRGIKAPCKVIE